ncbi:hypothetical protein CFP56_016702 [Quercus suber]|uniref:Uncharacterized protein n=1 Tax=Quercus suber TaxID=58331 RepID=A0AAW0KM16_QUESU
MFHYQVLSRARFPLLFTLTLFGIAMIYIIYTDNIIYDSFESGNNEIPKFLEAHERAQGQLRSSVAVPSGQGACVPTRKSSLAVNVIIGKYIFPTQSSKLQAPSSAASSDVRSGPDLRSKLRSAPSSKLQVQQQVSDPVQTSAPSSDPLQAPSSKFSSKSLIRSKRPLRAPIRSKLQAPSSNLQASVPVQTSAPSSDPLQAPSSKLQARTSKLRSPLRRAPTSKLRSTHRAPPPLHAQLWLKFPQFYLVDHEYWICIRNAEILTRRKDLSFDMPMVKRSLVTNFILN